ncbi:MAG: PAS domain S-box protein [Halanaerobiales bacterium]|nr:PAS domain S-box protein [Halanaerobiales bacterium]
MENFNCDNIFENMPLALAYNKVIYDDNNEIKDFIVLKTNKSLEEVTGFKKEDVINKKGFNILKDIINNPIEFIQICGEVASNGKSKSLEVYSKITGNYYEVRIFSDKEGYFATVFSDITERFRGAV